MCFSFDVSIFPIIVHKTLLLKDIDLVKTGHDHPALLSHTIRGFMVCLFVDLLCQPKLFFHPQTVSIAVLI